MQKTKQHGDQQRIRYLQRSVWREVNLPRFIDADEVCFSHNSKHC